MAPSPDRSDSGVRSWLPPLLLAALGAAYAVLVLFIPRPGNVNPAADTYWADYPNIVYALRALEEGHGLLWNRLQNCGQPFLGSTLVGLFYPPHALVVILGPERGMMAIAALHFAIGGYGMYRLCRELDLDGAAAFAAAVVFELGGVAVHFGSWLPWSLLGAYAWMPVALWRVERILRAPTPGNAIVLGVVLTLQLLIGYPQIQLFTYQAIALRTLWELGRRGAARLRIVAAVAFGGALPLGLGAAQLVPMLEFARESIRSRTFGAGNLGIAGRPTWEAYLGWRVFAGLGRLFTVAPVLLAGVALCRPGRWRVPLFYALLGALFFALVFDTPVQAVWTLLPVGQSFRWPQHALAVTGLAYAVLVGFGVDALVDRSERDRAQRLLPLAGVLLGGAALVALFPYGWGVMEWWETAVCIALMLWLAIGGPRPRLARAALVALVAWSVVEAARTPFTTLRAPVDVLYRRRPLFQDLQRRMTAQDRMYQLGKHQDHSLSAKSGQVFGLPSITDYEPQTSARYADLFIMMLRGEPLFSIWQFEFRGAADVVARRTLLDLMAARYLVLDREAAEVRTDDELARRVGPDLRLVHEDDGVAIYENARALPRAFFVPSARTIDYHPTLLQELATNADPRDEVLVEAPAVGGPAGGAGAGTGQVDIVADRSEEVVLRVRAPAAGYVFLADQYYPGWRATVDGVPVPIQRANYAFRMVPVPAGDTTVVFRYRPASVRLGLVVSATTLAGLVAYGLWRRRRPPQPLSSQRANGTTRSRAVSICDTSPSACAAQSPPA